MENMLLSAILLIGNTAVIYGVVKLLMKSVSSSHQKEVELIKKQHDLDIWHLNAEKNKLEHSIEVLVGDSYTDNEKNLVINDCLDRISRKDNMLRLRSMSNNFNIVRSKKQ